MSKSTGSKSYWKTPPPPEYLPCPPSEWLQKMNGNTAITFCHECENVFYVYDRKEKRTIQYLYQCNCLLF